MPVFHKNKLIHIHIPKTAGTAIERFFHSIGDMTWSPESWVGQEKKNGRWYEYQHLSMPELRSLAGTVFPGYASFAVVRDPYSRLVSDYTWRRLIQQHYPESPTQFFDTFDAFLNAIPEDISARWPDHIHSADQKWANFLIHVRPQHPYVLDEQGNCLVDDILEYEKLDKDLGVVLRRHGLHAEGIRSPPNREIDEYFSREKIKKVNEIYARDFELFSFSKK
jgi:hypothetical protein